MIEGGEYGLANAAVVTPSDTVNLPVAARALWVGGTGAVKVDTVGGQTVTFTAVPAGVRLPVQVKRVYAAGTSATLMLALY